MVMDEQHRVHAGNDTELCTFFRVETINIRLPPFCHNNCFFHGSLKRITQDKQSRAPAQPPEPEVQAERAVGGPGKGFLTRSRASPRCTPRSRGAPPPSTRLAQSLVPRGNPGSWGASGRLEGHLAAMHSLPLDICFFSPSSSPSASFATNLQLPGFNRNN